MSSRTRFACALMAGAACLAAPSLVLAAAPAPASGGIGDIVVTARKTSESLQRTPVAVTALTSTAITQRQVTNIIDLQRIAPNIQIISGSPSSPGFAFIAMRGEYNIGGNSESDPSIAVYLDGVYEARDAASAMNINDLQSVQVLHGPQGTLFGRNTTGGAILVTTNKPTDDFEGLLQASFGNYGDFDDSIMLNIPIKGDEVETRFNFRHHQHSGYGQDVITGQPLNDLIGDNQFRGEVKIAPDGQRWNLLLSGDYEYYRDSGQEQALIAANPASALAFLAFLPGNTGSLTPYLANSSNFYQGFGADYTGVDPNFFAHEFYTAYGVSGTLDVDLGAVKLKSISAYRGSNSYGSNNLAGVPQSILYSASEYPQQQVSEELQLSGNVDKLNWIAGAVYFKEWGTERSNYQAFGFLNQVFFPGASKEASNFGNYNNESEGVFVQLNYQLTDKLRATGGVRYTWDQRNVVIHNENPWDPATGIGGCIQDDGGNTGQTVPQSQCNHAENANFAYPSWLASLDYQATPTLMVYAKTSGATMAGGWNLRATNVPAFAPESLKDVEVGLKADWFDHHLRTDIALFHNWKTNIQQSVVGLFAPPGSPPGTTPVSTLFISNGGNAQINGMEFEGTLDPWEGMEITTGVGWMNGGYDKGSFIDKDVVFTAVPIAGCSIPFATTSGPAVACPVDRSGEPLLQFPKVTFNIGATQTIPLSFGKLIAHLDYDWTDAVHFYALTPAAQQDAGTAATYATANQLGVLAARGLLNGMLTLSLNDPQVDISLWCKNCTGTKYYTWGLDQYAAYGGALGIDTGFIGDPMTYGVTLKYRFGGR